MSHQLKKSRIFGILSIALGLSLLVAQMLSWGVLQYNAALRNQISVLNFFILEIIYLFIIFLGSILLMNSFSNDELRDNSTSWLFSQVFNSSSDKKVGVLAAIAYALFYSFVSSMIVYQPSVDFAIYGVRDVSWVAIPCCGSIGSIPMIVIYLIPQLHIALQILPLDLLLLFILSILIFVNYTLISFSLKRVQGTRSDTLLSSAGALVALFTACPTCAGYFLASIIGGFGATTIALALAPYQFLFITISIPLLLLSPILIARRISNAYPSGCTVRAKH